MSTTSEDTRSENLSTVFTLLVVIAWHVLLGYIIHTGTMESWAGLLLLIECVLVVACARYILGGDNIEEAVEAVRDTQDAETDED